MAIYFKGKYFTQVIAYTRDVWYFCGTITHLITDVPNFDLSYSPERLLCFLSINQLPYTWESALFPAFQSTTLYAVFLATDLIFYIRFLHPFSYFQQLSLLQLSHASRFLFTLFNFGLLSLAGQKVSIFQHKVLHPLHRSSFTSMCRVRVPCRKICHKLISSSHGLVLFLKMSCSVCKMLLPQLPCPVHSLLVFCLWSFFASYYCSPTFRNRVVSCTKFHVTLFTRYPCYLKEKKNELFLN
jgi:hypothetical protein